MRIRLLVGALVASAACGSGVMALNNNLVAPKHTIKEVMKIAHKDGLMKKVQSGEGSDEEKKQLLDLYIDLVSGEPKKGDPTEWKMAAGAVMMSAAKVVVGREGALDELKKATDCKTCHDKFK